jgi:hypothetical protein
MSTNFVHVVPRDPFFVPTPEVEDQARRWFGQAMPGGWEITSTVMRRWASSTPSPALESPPWGGLSQHARAADDRVG